MGIAPTAELEYMLEAGGGEMALSSKRRILAALPITALVVAACGAAASPSPSAAAPTAGPSAAAGSLAVALQEWAVLPASPSVAAGEVTFTVTNTGPADEHEFVVLRTDIDANALPTDETGTVTEGGEGMEVVDEIEDIPVGETQDLTVTLTAGKYVLLCNIYSEDEDEAHYKMGMRTNFTVTE
jgi:uncharacterized cupredoxin-like copper-binding protein